MDEQAVATEMNQVPSENTDKSNTLQLPRQASRHVATASLSTYEDVQQSVGLSWTDIEYTVRDKSKTEKRIIDGNCGYVEPGKVLCILGPSGSGKTTLLQILSGLRPATSGNIYFNGREKTESKLSEDITGYQGNSAYIAQEDTLCGSLTVLESLQYAAMLKASNLTQKEREILIANTIVYLGLSSCSNTIIGNIVFKGISGGQKRRVSIGIELMGRPSLLFMDEITSGLDSTSSYQIMGVVDALSKKGHTIIMTIHQPSSRIFDMMNKRDFSMMVLSSGKTMYFGKVRDLVPYLTNINYQIPQFSNPCDYVLDLVNFDFAKEDDESTNDDTMSTLIDANIAKKENIMNQIDILNKSQSESDIKEATFASVWRQIIVLLKLGNDTHGQQDRLTAIYNVSAFFSFMCVSAMPVFVEERSIFIRERGNNHYGTFAYCFANFLSSLPWIFLISLFCSVIIHFTVQSRIGFDFFFIYLANLFVMLVVSESLMVALSAISSHFMVGLTLGAGTLALYFMTTYYLVPSLVPIGWYWIHRYVSFHTYTFIIFVKNDFEDYKEGQIDGNALLEYYEMDKMEIRDCFIYLCIMMLVYKIIFYVLLRLLNRK